MTSVGSLYAALIFGRSVSVWGFKVVTSCTYRGHFLFTCSMYRLATVYTA